MCPFNQHWLVDCNSTMKLRLLYLHRSSELSLWPCHAPSRGFTLQPHNQPTRLCDIILGPVLGMLKSDACHAHSHSSSISKAFDGKRGKKRKNVSSVWTLAETWGEERWPWIFEVLPDELQTSTTFVRLMHQCWEEWDLSAGFLELC